MKYIERLQQSAEDKKSKDVQFMADKAKLQLQSDILATQQSLADMEANKEAELNSQDVDFSDLVEIENQIDNLKAGLAILEKYQEELF